MAIIICAIWMLTDPTFLFSMTQEDNHYYIALYIFLAVGALMLIVAFLGCCGAFKESQCLLVSVRPHESFIANEILVTGKFACNFYFKVFLLFAGDNCSGNRSWSLGIPQ